MQSNHRHGFSLVELSIVLVILGLLVGGILAGQSLIRASELRSVTTDVGKYTTATFAFKDKYFGLPGDLSNATAIWGIAGGTTGNDGACFDVASTDAKTCNGNGNGLIADYNVFETEGARYWQQLANAGLIEGSFNGRAYNATGFSRYGCVIGSICPSMKLAGATMYPTGGTFQGSTEYTAFPSANYLLVGKPNLSGGSTNDRPLGAIVTTQEAWNLDTKMDDGKPYYGSVQTYTKKGASSAWLQDVNNCANSTAITAEYDLTRDGLSCAFRILLAK